MSAQSDNAAPAPPSKAPVRRLFAAAAVYFAIVFVTGLVLGPARVLWLEAYVGETIAVLCEAPLLLAAMVVGAVVAPRLTGMAGRWPAYVLMGVLAFAFQQIADLAVGFGLRGMTLRDQLAYFATPPGYIYALTLAAFVLMPLIVRLRRRPRRSEHLTAIKGPDGG